GLAGTTRENRWCDHAFARCIPGRRVARDRWATRPRPGARVVRRAWRRLRCRLRRGFPRPEPGRADRDRPQPMQGTESDAAPRTRNPGAGFGETESWPAGAECDVGDLGVCNIRAGIGGHVTFC